MFISIQTAGGPRYPHAAGGGAQYLAVPHPHRSRKTGALLPQPAQLPSHSQPTNFLVQQPVHLLAHAPVLDTNGVAGIPPSHQAGVPAVGDTLVPPDHRRRGEGRDLTHLKDYKQSVKYNQVIGRVDFVWRIFENILKKVQMEVLGPKKHNF